MSPEELKQRLLVLQQLSAAKTQQQPNGISAGFNGAMGLGGVNPQQQPPQPQPVVQQYPSQAQKGFFQDLRDSLLGLEESKENDKNKENE